MAIPEPTAARRRLLFVDHSLIVGGAQLALVEHLRALDRGRFQPIVLCADGATELHSLYREAGAELQTMSFPRLRKPNPLVLVRLFQTAREVRRTVQALRAELVVASTARVAYTCAVALAGSGVPLVWWVHDFQFNRLLFRAGAWGAARVICVSGAVRDYYGGRSDPRFHVVVVGSHLHRALATIDAGQVLAERRRWGFEAHDVVVGFMGRLVAEKGAEDLIFAAAALHGRNARMKLLVVGTGKGQTNDVERHLHELVAGRGWDFVKFAGFQSNEALYYSLFDILVLPSRAAEGYAMSVVQAMIARTPVVVSEVGGMRELVRDRETGMLVPPSSPDRLASAIAELADNATLRQRLIAAAHAQVMMHNRVEVTTARTERIYDELIAHVADRRRRSATSLPSA